MRAWWSQLLASGKGSEVEIVLIIGFGAIGVAAVALQPLIGVLLGDIVVGLALVGVVAVFLVHRRRRAMAESEARIAAQLRMMQELQLPPEGAVGEEPTR